MELIFKSPVYTAVGMDSVGYKSKRICVEQETQTILKRGMHKNNNVREETFFREKKGFYTCH